MNYQEKILHLHSQGDIHRIYEEVDEFDYMALKSCYEQGNATFKKELSEVKSAYGNTLYHITMYQEDAQLFLELCPETQAPASVFEVCAFYSLMDTATEQQAYQIYCAFTQQRFHFNAVNYAHACYYLLSENNKPTVYYDKIAKSLFEQLHEWLDNATDTEHARFYYLFETLIERAELSEEVSLHLYRDKDKKRLFNQFFTHHGIIAQAYGLEANLSENIVKGHISHIAQGLRHYFDRLPDDAMNMEEVLSCFEQRRSDIIDMNEKDIQNTFLDNQHIIYLQDFVAYLSHHLNEHGEMTQVQFLRSYLYIIKEEMECLNYPLEKNYIQEYLDEKGLSNIYVQNKLAGNKKTSHELISLIESLDPLYQQLLGLCPVFIKSNSTECLMEASVFAMENTPLLIDVKHFAPTILTHELTHLLQMLYAKHQRSHLAENEKWQHIKTELLTQAFPEPKDVAELLNNLLSLDEAARLEHTVLCEHHLLHLLKTCDDTYSTDKKVQKYIQNLSPAFIHNLLVSYKLSYDKKEDFLSIFQKNMDTQIQREYYRTDMEFHARVCEYLYTNSSVKAHLLYALTFGLGDKTQIKTELLPKVKALNEHMFQTITHQPKIYKIR